MPRIVSLQNDFSRRFVPSASAGDLRQQLKGFFRRHVIGIIQTLVAFENSDQRNAGKVVPFCNHLRAHEN